jgi:RNA methyltransferase, TrmH family
MLTERITSQHNPLIKRFRAVRDGRERHILFVEGTRAVEEAFKADLSVESVIFSDEFISSEASEHIKQYLEACRCRGAAVPAKIFASVCDTVTPQGVALIARQPYYSVEDVLKNGSLVIVADQLQDPGNIGTIIRTCAAVGAAGLISTRGTVDPFGHKAVRASMGAAFRLPIATDAVIQDVIENSRSAKYTIVAAHKTAKTVYTDHNWKKPALIILGNEGAGLSSETLLLASERVRVPQANNVESLNVAAAAAVLLYEAARQRHFKGLSSE